MESYKKTKQDFKKKVQKTKTNEEIRKKINAISLPITHPIDIANVIPIFIIVFLTNYGHFTANYSCLSHLTHLQLAPVTLFADVPYRNLGRFTYTTTIN